MDHTWNSKVLVEWVWAFCPLLMPHLNSFFSRCSMNVSVSEYRNPPRCASHDSLMCWLDTDAGHGMIPFDSCLAKSKYCFSNRFPVMANLMKCWTSVRAHGGPGLVRAFLSPLLFSCILDFWWHCRGTLAISCHKQIIVNKPAVLRIS